MKRRLFSVRVCAGAMALALTLASMPVSILANAEEQVSYKDGTYSGSGQGRNGEVTLSVTIKDGRVEQVKEEAQKESSWAWDKAKALLDTINEKKPSLAEIDEIDGVSGATLSSNGIKAATKDAFSKAEVKENSEDNPVVDEPENPENPEKPEEPENPSEPEPQESEEIKGDGTWSNPYQLGSVAQLKKFAENVDNGTSYAGEYVVLTADIDLSGEENFNTIGTEDGFSIFAGTFDGKGYSISNMKVDASSVANEGLFTAIKANAVVKNVNIVNANLKASGDYSLNIGILAGDVKKAASVNSCHVSGTITTNGDTPVTVGGVVGNMMLKSELANCSADIKIQCDIKEGQAADIGGVAGLTKMNAKVLNSAAKGSITVSNDTVANIGGIVGNAMGHTVNVVSAVTVSSDGSSGSICGKADEFGKASKYYSTSDMKAMGNVKEAAEKDFDATLLCANLSDLHKSYENITFNKWVGTGTDILPKGDEWHETAVDSSIFDGGDGSKENPYKIANANQLLAFAKSLNAELLYDNKYVELTADIDVSDVANFEPIGGSQFAFNGTFDGKGHVINGLTEGTKENPRKLSKNLEDFSNAIGLFGNLGVDACVKNLHLTNVAIYVYREDASFVGGIAGYMQGLSDGSSFKGAVIDSCSVTGVIESTTHEKNAYVGGIAARQYKGAIINCYSEVALKSTVEYGESIASCGGITGMTNRGLVANCYSKGSYFGSMARDIENEIEGMSAVGSIVGVDAGDVVNCYCDGDTVSEHYSIYTGAVTGWVTGIGKAYQSYYNKNRTMTIAGRKEAEVQAYGTKTVGGVNEEGEAYEGGVVAKLYGFDTNSYKQLAEKLNANFDSFGINLSKYGLGSDSLKKWGYVDGEVKLLDEYAVVTYVQPEEEKVPVAEIIMMDGVWYGRDREGKTTVKITVKDNEIVAEEILKGSKEDESYEKALAIAKDKAVYGDETAYGKADTSIFDGGKGTKESPYLISNEKQLRYLAEAINADETWENVYFKQTGDITLSSENWKPIGFAIKAKIKGDPVLYSAYPFRGHFDGGNHVISGLTIGSKLEPAHMYTAAMFGFIGGDYESNLTYGDDTLKAEISGVKLRDIYINNEVPFETYTAGLVGTGQNGVFIDNCSVTGKLSVKADDIASRGAGLAASMLRGQVTNCYTDVAISAITEDGDVYAGGMFAVTNRINVLNCYTLGNVYGTANTNNKVHIGGFTGMAGAFQYNCFAMGNVTSNRPTVDIGVMDGRIANIAYDRNCYFNSDAKLVENGVTIESVYTGADGTGSSKDVTFGKTSSEIASKEFAALLNSNVKNVVSELEAADEELGGIMSIYYTGGEAGLLKWKTGPAYDVNAHTEYTHGTAPSKTESHDYSTTATATASNSTTVADTKTPLALNKSVKTPAVTNSNKKAKAVKNGSKRAVEESVNEKDEELSEAEDISNDESSEETITEEETPKAIDGTENDAMLSPALVVIVVFIVAVLAGILMYIRRDLLKK